MKPNNFRAIIITALLSVLFATPLFVQANDYYWVGGSGYWSDINHWATSSGGGVLHSQVPTANDNVFFDVNSFTVDNDSVVINLKNAVCRDMSWSGVIHNPILAGIDTTNLRIFGSLTLAINMQQNYSGDFVFEATSQGKIITSAGHTFNNNVIFNGDGGGWKLLDNFSCTKSVQLNKGVFQTNGMDFVCNDFISETQFVRSLLLASSNVNVNTWSIDGTNLSLDALNAVFTVGLSLSNNNGSQLNYPDIHFTGISCSIINSNVFVIYQDLFFASSGSIGGDCNINDVLFNNNGTISGNDTIHYVTVKSDGVISGGSVIQKVDIANFGNIYGSNEINFLTIKMNAEIDSINNITTALCNSTALIDGENNIDYLSVKRQAYFDGQNNTQAADLYGDGYFIGDNQFDTLNFYPGRTYVFNCHSTQTIRDVFQIDGTCNKPIRMFADTNGVQAGIHKVHGSVSGQYLSLRDLKATGVTPFNASNSVDLGNNSGWNIQTTNGENLYWVNGGGNWSDNIHWDTQSGGIGGHCPPTEIDNAFFDGNSFPGGNSTAIVDIENAVCKDLIWKNGVASCSFTGADTNNLHIYGSLQEHGVLDWNIKGKTFFEAVSSGQTIFSAENIFPSQIWFTGRGGSWDFLDDFKTDSEIFFQQGIINTLGNDVRCDMLSSTDTTTRGLNLSTTTWTLIGVMKAVWQMNSANFTLHGDSSLLISQGMGAHILNFGSNKRLVYHDVKFLDSGSQLINQGTYCVFNVVEHFGKAGIYRGDCTIDSALFHNENGLILNNDSINVAIFDKKTGEIRGGNHIVKKAIFFDDGIIRGNNMVDTALFYRDGSVYDTNLIDTTIIYNKALIKGSNQIRTATLLSNGHFFGNNTFNNLKLSKSSVYYLEHDQTQTVIDNLYLNGSCTGPIFIQSDKNEQQATIKKVNDTVEAYYVQLRDIKGEGQGIPFTAYNSVDLGNNTNWNIYESSPKELYWVNGDGVWSDSLHWSGMSGGQGGYCIPTPIDNVYFDQNSFLDINDTVFINIGNATCHNMDWTGSKFTPVFYSPDTNFLRIYGGLKLNDAMNFELKGAVFFESTHNDNHILMRTQSFDSLVYFQGIGGEWILDDTFASSAPVYFLTGTLRSNGNTLSVYAFNTNFDNQRNLILDNSLLKLTGDAIEVWYLNGLNLNYSAVNTVFEIDGFSDIFRTDNGGPFNYPYLDFAHSGWIFNRNTQVSFDSVLFMRGGQIHGDCSIEKVHSQGPLSIFDSDDIGSVYVESGNFSLVGGNHKVNTIFAGGSATVSGNNQIDTIIISGIGSMSGTNSITGLVDFGDEASVSGNNFAHRALFRNNGTFNGENEFDVLRFFPGNIYELEESKTQTVNDEFFIRGNNCFPITLRSQHDGQQAIITMPQGRTVSGDFIEIKDINATGGALFYAGHYSTDLSDNSGWIFDNAPGYIFGFNNDTVACLGGNMVIGTENFNPDDNSTFLWMDGSTDSQFILHDEDTVWVTVTYASNCSFTDTVAITYKDSPQVELGSDQTMCSGDTVSITYHSDSVSFEWGDGSTDSVIRVTQTGYYTVTVTNAGGCSASDSVFVNALPAPEVNLGPDTTIFSNQEFLLDADNSGASYIWSTGDTTQSITVNGEGDYLVVVLKDGCRGYDTISVSVYPDCILAIPNAFSPNGDGHNDILYIRGDGFTDVELMIFNRIGEMVFETKDNSIGWDGSFRGKQQPVDVYMYSLKGTCVSGQTIVKKGNITLLR